MLVPHLYPYSHTHLRDLFFISFFLSEFCGSSGYLGRYVGLCASLFVIAYMAYSYL